MNRILLMGSVESISKLQTFQHNNKEFCELIIKTDSNHFNSQGQWKHQEDFHKISVWGRGAVNCTKYLKNGGLVYIDGVLNGSPNIHDDSPASLYCSRVQFLNYPDGKEHKMIPAIVNGAPNPELETHDLI